MKLKEIRREEKLEFKEKRGEVLCLIYAVNGVKHGWNFVKWLREKDRERNDFAVEITSSFSPGNSHDEDPSWTVHVWKENTHFPAYSRKPLSEEEIDKIHGCRRAECVFQGKQMLIYCKNEVLIIKISEEDNVNLQELEEQLGLNEAVDWEAHLYSTFAKKSWERDWWMEYVMKMDFSDSGLMWPT